MVYWIESIGIQYQIKLSYVLALALKLANKLGCILKILVDPSHKSLSFPSYHSPSYIPILENNLYNLFTERGKDQVVGGKKNHNGVKNNM